MKYKNYTFTNCLTGRSSIPSDELIAYIEIHDDLNFCECKIVVRFHIYDGKIKITFGDTTFIKEELDSLMFIVKYAMKVLQTDFDFLKASVNEFLL